MISSIIDNKYEKRIRYGISILIIIMIVPSFYLAYNIYKEKKFTKTAEQFVQEEFENSGYTVIYKKINYNSSPKTIDLAFFDKKTYSFFVVKKGILSIKNSTV